MTPILYPDSERRVTKLLEIIHTDVCGFMREKCLRQYIFYLIYRRLFPKVWSSISDVKGRNPPEDKENAESPWKRNGKEYVKREFNEYLKAKWIKRRLTVPIAPSGTGKQNAPSHGEMFAIGVRNAVKALRRINFLRRWTGKISAVLHLRVFGTRVFTLDRKTSNTLRRKEGPFVGYSNEARSYKVWLLETTRDIRFIQRDAKIRVWAYNSQQTRQNIDGSGT